MDVPPTRARLLSRLDPWAPPLALMVVIFVLSAQPDLSTGLGAWDLVARKIVHVSEYGLLCFLWWRALRELVSRRRAAIVLAFCVSLAYAGTDELHQTFVHGRHGTPVDVGIDAAGMAAACALIVRREP
jgi:VanZ family protein